MCLVALAIAQQARFPLLLVSNRDEFFHRAAEPLAWWQPGPGMARVLGGRDLSAGGTWLGLNANGRLALVTNVREPGRHLPDSPSRGALVVESLLAERPDAPAVLQTARNGFNLLTLELAAPTPGGWWASNRPQDSHLELDAGVHGLSNAALNTPWPKVKALCERVRESLAGQAEVDTLIEAGFAALRDDRMAADEALPRTGVPLQRERQLSPAFIRIAESGAGVYGTRCSTVVLVEDRGEGRTVHVVEQIYDETGQVSGRRNERLALPP